MAELKTDPEYQNPDFYSIHFLDHVNLNLLIIGKDNSLRRILTKKKAVQWEKFMSKKTFP